MANNTRRISLFIVVAVVVLMGILTRLYVYPLKRAGTPLPPFTILYTGSTWNYLEPCGCCRHQVGGLPRRLTAIKKFRNNDTPVLLVDSGNQVDYYLSNQTRELERRKIPMMHEALDMVQYDAINIGESDLSLLPELSQALGKKESESPYLSTNVTLKEHTLKPWIMKKTGDGFVAIAGITRVPGGPTGVYTSRDPEESLSRLSALRKKASFIVLLSQMGQEEDRRIARLNPWINLIIGSREGTPIQEGTTCILPTGTKGEYLGKAEVTYDRRSEGYNVKAGLIPLNDGINEDNDMRALLNSLYKERLEIAVLQDNDELMWRSTAQYCGKCHTSEYVTWKNTKHAIAFDDLINKGKGPHPGCVPCHGTMESDTGKSAIFEKAVYRSQVNVQCIMCHMKSPKHYASGKQLTENNCVQCHDKEHSREFNYQTYRKKILMRKEAHAK